VLSPRIQLRSPASGLRDGFARIRARMELPTGFPGEVLSEAQEAAGREHVTPDRRDRLDLDFVTIDGARSGVDIPGRTFHG